MFGQNFLQLGPGETTVVAVVVSQLLLFGLNDEMFTFFILQTEVKPGMRQEVNRFYF